MGRTLRNVPAFARALGDTARFSTRRPRGMSFRVLVMTSLLLLVPAVGYEVPEVEWMFPSMGVTGGGDLLTLKGGANLAEVRSIGGATVECAVDGTLTPATFVGDDTVTCIAPPHKRPGFVHVQFAVNKETSTALATAGTGFQYVTYGSVTGLTPRYGQTGSALDVFGQHFKPWSVCWFEGGQDRAGTNNDAEQPSGYASSTTHFVSSVLIKCEAPFHGTREGAVAVDVSNGERESLARAKSAVEFTYAPVPATRHVSPRSGSTAGGTVVRVEGWNFANTNLLRCRIGTITTSGVWRSATSVTCVAPASRRVAEDAQTGHLVTVSTNGKDFTTGNQKFTYHAPSGVDAVFPLTLPAVGGAKVVVHLPVAHPSEAPRCRFGKHVTDGSLEPGGALFSCVAPSLAAGFVAVHVSRNGEDFEHLPYGQSPGNAVVVQTKEAMEIRAVFPEVGYKGGGSVLFVTGQNLLFDGVLCRFGFRHGPYVFVSSALVLCETPTHEPVTAALELAAPAATATEPLVRPNFVFHDLPIVTGANPTGGFSQGGNVVVVAGYFFSEMHDMHCRFGTVGYVAGAWIADDEYRCVAPARAPGFVILDVGIKGDFAPRTPLAPPTTYQYTTTPELTTVTGNADGTVTIIGTGFTPGDKVYCSLGPALGFVPGTVVDSNTISCEVTEHGLGDIDPAGVFILDDDGNNLLGVDGEGGLGAVDDARVSVDKVGPSSGPNQGGTAVVVRGENFTPHSMCRFGSHDPTPASFVSSTQIVCVAPANAAGGGVAVEVSNNGVDWTGGGKVFQYELRARVDYVAPRRGSVDGGSLLRISGSLMPNTESLACRVGTISFIAARWISQSASACLVPAHAAGAAPVGLASHFGDRTETEMDVDFTYAPVPNITAVFPVAGSVSGGTQVTVTGSDFPTTGRATCKFGATPVNALRRTATTIVCAAPSQSAGWRDVEISINRLDFTLNSVQFKYVAPPSAYAVFPKTGAGGGGSVVAVNGDHFQRDAFAGDDRATSCVFANRTIGQDTSNVVSSRLMRCETPAASFETGTAHLELSINEYDTTKDLTTFRYVTQPTVSGAYPNAGAEAGGGVVTVYGSFASYDSDDVSCRVGTIVGIQASLVTPTTIACQMPSHVPGPVAVDVSLNGAEYTDGELRYDYEQGYEVFGPTPKRVLASGGGLVSLSFSPGRDTLSELTCVIDENPVPAVRVSTGTFLCLTPPRAPGFAALALATADAEVVSVSNTVLVVEYAVPPVVTDLAPRVGIAHGVSVVKVTGRHLSGDDLFCRLGHGGVVAAHPVSSALVKCEAPAHEPGLVVLEVSATEHASQFARDNGGPVFEYVVETAITGLFPTHGPQTGGTIVKITLSASTDAAVAMTCRFGTVGPLVSRGAPGSGVECASPAHSSGLTAVAASVDDETWTLSSELHFGYAPSAKVYAVAPASGSVAGGGVVIVRGTGFEGEAIKCRFGEEIVAGAYVGGDELCVTKPYLPPIANASVTVSMMQTGTRCMGWVEVMCIAPPQAAGVVTLEVSASGSAFSTSEVAFAFQPAAVVASMQPTSGPTAGVGVVDIVGKHLLGDALCGFGSSEPVSAHVVSSAMVKCEAPAHVPGVAGVEIGTGDEGQQFSSSGLAYEYVDEARMVGITPRQGPQSGGTIVRIALSTVDTSVVSACRFGTIGPLTSRAAGYGVECASPAREGGPVIVSVSGNGEVWDVSELGFVYMASSTVLAVAPASASTVGGTAVRVMGNGFEGESIKCRFGMEIVSGAYVGGDELCVDHSDIDLGSTVTVCMGWVEVICIAPPHAAGVVTLEVSASGSAFSTSEVAFAYQPAAVIFSVHPASGPTAGVGVVKIVGDDLLGDALCGFGSSEPVSAHVVSSVLVKCEAPAHAPGVAGFEIGTGDEGQQFSSSGLGYEYVDEARMVGITPRQGPQSGGTIVRIALSTVDTSVVSACRFGTIGPLTSRAAGYGVECASPAREGGPVIVSVSGNGEVWDVSELGFVYMASSTVLAVAPASASTVGGTAVRVFGAGVPRENIFCRFGMEVVSGAYVGGDELCVGQDPDDSTSGSLMTVDRCMGWVEVMCIAPLHAAGVVTLEVSASEGGFSTSQVAFAYQPAAVVVSMQPTSGPTAGVGVVDIAGKHLLGDALCGFGSSEPVSAHVVSSAMVKCEAPAHFASLVSFELSIGDGGQQFSSSGLVYEYADEARVVGIEPHEGPQDGGTMVRIALSTVDTSVVSACRFGTIGPLTSRAAGYGVECASPAREGGPVIVSVSGNGKIWFDSDVAFEYTSSASVFALTPETGTVGGGTAVHVMGTGLRAGLVKCRFGMEIVTGAYVGGDELCVGQDPDESAPGSMLTVYRCMGWVEVICIAPPQAAGVVTLEVSASEGGFSTSKVAFAYQPAAVIFSVHPASGPTSGVGVVTVVGQHLLGDALCGFGSSEPVSAHVVSSAMVKCEAPAHAPGEVAVEISVAGAFSNNAVLYSYEVGWLPVGLIPARGPGSGGTLVTLALSDVPSRHIACSFGVVFPVIGRAERYALSCVSSSSTAVDADAVIPVGATFLGAGVLESPYAFSYLPEPETEAVMPVAVSSGGGALVTVEVGNLAAGVVVECRFGLVVVPATRDGNAASVVCVAPRSAPGFVTIGVGLMDPLDGQPTSLTSPTRRELVDFAFNVPAVVFSVTPRAMAIGGGTIVRVPGAHISRDSARLCAFGDNTNARVQVVAVSSALAFCEAPARFGDDDSVETTIRLSLHETRDVSSASWSETAATVTRVEKHLVYDVFPRRVGESGGATLVVHGARFVGAADADACVFGAVSPVLGRAVSHERVECVSPSAAGGARFVSVVNREDNRLVADGGAAVTIVVPPKLAAAYPTRGPAVGGTRLVVIVDGDVETDDAGGVVDAACAFGERLAPASSFGNAGYGALNATTTAFFVGAPNVWACFVPPTPPGFIGVHARASDLTESGMGREGITFAFAPTAAVRAMQPATVTDDARAVVRVVGVHLPEDGGGGETGAVLCAFGDVEIASPAVFVSSALVVCESPGASVRGGGAFQLRLVTEGGESWTGDDGATLAVVPSTRAVEVSPAVGWEVGGIAVAVAVIGDGAAAAEAAFPPFACQFGAIAPVAARAAGPDTVLCVAPAASAGVRPVGVVQGLVDIAAGAPTFTFRRGPSIVAAAPAVASTVGDGTEVVFYLDALGGDADATNAEELACHVDDAIVPARASAAGVSCVLPARAPGVAEISLVSASFAYGVGPRGVGVGRVREDFVTEMHFVAPPTLRAHLPRSSPTVGGTVLMLIGDHFAGAGEIYGAGTSHACAFGAGTLSQVDVVSSGVARCEAPSRGFHGETSMTLRLGDGPVGATAAFRGAVTNSATHTYYTQPYPVSLDPDSAGSQGGARITVHGTGFMDVDTLACKVGTIGPILAKFLDENSITCVMPARRPSPRGDPQIGSYPLEVSLNAVDYSDLNLTTVSYFNEGPDAADFEKNMTIEEALGLVDGYTYVLDVRVPTGPVTGGTVSTIEGANFYEPQTTCRFQTTQSPGIIVNKFRLMCITPPHQAGFAAYEIITGATITTFGFQFHFHARAFVTLLEPDVGSTRGGEVVFVNGKNFLRSAEIGETPDRVGTFCALGTTSVEPGFFVSSALVKCETTNHVEEADLALEVTLNRLDLTNSKRLYRVRNDPGFAFAAPYRAPAAGGTAVTVSGGPFREGTFLGCRFGTIGPVPAVMLDSGEAVCVTPSHVPQAVPLFATLNGKDLSQLPIRFHFRTPPVVESVFPEQGVTRGGARITVVGSYLEQGEQAYCRVGAQLVATDTVSPNVMACVSPPAPPGFVKVGVADGAEDGNVAGKEHQGAWFHYQAPAVTLAAHPPVGDVGGGALVRVIGNELISLEPGGLLCHFGGDAPSTARVLSSALATCESGAHREGAVALELSASGPVSGFNSAVFEFAKTPFPAALFPTAGPTEGGAVVEATTAGADAYAPGSSPGGASAQFGTVWPLALRVSSRGTVEFLTPARAPGVSPVSFSTDASSTFANALALTFVTHAASPEAIAASPDVATAGDGAVVEVTFQKRGVYDDAYVPDVCRFGMDVSSAVLVNTWDVCVTGTRLIGTTPASSEMRGSGKCVGFATVRCVAPSQAAPGWTTVTVAARGATPASIAAFGGAGPPAFEIRTPPVVYLVMPGEGPSYGGSLLKITGAHMRINEDACWVGAGFSGSVDARVVSSALATCETPAHEPMVVAIAVSAVVSDAPPSVTDVAANFAYGDDVASLSATPRRGSTRGGAAVTVTTHPAIEPGRATFSAACHVGTIRVAARRVSSGFECVVPAVDPSVLATKPVALSLNGEDRIPEITGASGGVDFEYRPDLEVLATTVETASSIGGAAVVAEVACPSRHGGVSLACGDVFGVLRNDDFEGLACLFGEHSTPASFDTTTSRPGTASVRCASPPIAPGFVRFRLGLASAPGFDAIAMHGSFHAIAFETPPVTYTASPAQGSANGGTLVFLVGAHFPVHDAALVEGVFRALCVFGDAPPSTPRVVSSSLAICESPAASEGVAIVALAAGMGNGGGVRFETVPQPRALGASPRSAAEHGGATVEIVGSGFREGARARFGSLAPVAARLAGFDRIETIAPASVAGRVVPVETCAGDLFGSNAWTDDGSAYFSYHQARFADGVSRDAAHVTGGAEVVVFGGGGARDDSPVCFFGDVAVESVTENPGSWGLGKQVCIGAQCLGWTTSACASPVHAPGFVVLGFGRAGEGAPSAAGGGVFSFASTTFAFHVPPKVNHGFPEHSPSAGGGLVFVLGNHFKPGDGFSQNPSCRFGEMEGETSPATAVSSALLLCETPERFVGVVSLAVNVFGDSGGVSSIGFVTSRVTGKQSAKGNTGAQVTHRFAPTPRVTNGSPFFGPERGGSVVSVRGAGFQDETRLGCRFGAIYPVAGRFLGGDLVTCVTPAGSAGTTVPVGVTGNGRDYTPGGGLFGSRAAFTYQESVKVTGVTPRSGVTGGRTPVFITGAGFVNATSLSCRLGREIVPATYLSPFTLLCVAPEQPTGAGTVFIEVSNNAKDWTSQRTLFHFAPCPAGYYCPEGEPLPCPRGAFCGGGSGGAANFTLCPVGTFQPRTSQSSCLPAPIGFVAPDVGTSQPSVCPRGAVCDTTGLTGTSKACPPGHYCLEGTRTSNFTDFGTPERPLPCPFGTYCGPGVTTNRTIANNFTTPQTCFAGYMCEPGSATPQGSGPCPSGHYCPPGELIPCPSRTYCPGVANTEPKPCIPGLYQQEPGQASCKKCPLGTICPGFARELPEPCPPGYVCDAEGLPIPAKRCPAGHYCLRNTLTPDPLSALDTDALLRASPVAISETQFRPLPCLPATYCMEGVENNVTNAGVFSQPQPCKEGSYCEWGTSDNTIVIAGDVSSPMLPCPPGNYCPKGTYIPIPVPRGYFAPGEGNSAATMCLPGLYTPYEGFQTCLACPAGYECAVDGTYKPTVCRSGTVRSLRDSITCRNCPMGTWSPFRGTTDESLCVPCNPGLVCSTEGAENNKPFGDSVSQITNQFIVDCELGLSSCETVELQPLGQAVLCPEGYVCDARTAVAAVKCPDGYFCGYGTTPETQFFNKCPMGYFCPQGTAASGRFQFPCAACHYCPPGTGVILPRCPEGTKSDANAESIDECLADRITFWRVQPLKRTLVDEAYAILLAATKEENADRRRSRSLLELGVGPETARVGGAFMTNPPSDVLEDENAPPPSAVTNLSPKGLAMLGDLMREMPNDFDFQAETQRRRVLLQTSDGDISQDSSAGDNATDTGVNNSTASSEFDTSYFGHCRGLNFGLLNPKFIANADGTPATDIQGTPMVKFTLPRGHTAKIKLDFRFIDDFIRHGAQYEVAVFIDDRVDDMMCDEDDYEVVPCPPWDNGDGINKKTMGLVPDAGMEVKCPKSTEALELPFWFARNGLHGAAEHNVDAPAMGTYVWKRGLHELNIGGLDEVSFRFEIRMLHGLYQNSTRRGFLDTMCVDTTFPERGGAVDKSSFHVILMNDDELQIPLNVPFREPFQRSIELDYFLCTEKRMEPSCRWVYPSLTLDYNSTLASEWKQYLKRQELAALAGLEILGVATADDDVMVDDVIIDANGDMHVPDVTEKQQNIFIEDYWSEGRPLLAIDYLPFFSGCRGFDSHVYLYQLFETAWTSIEDFVSYGNCDLVPVNETVFIDQWSPQIQIAIADSCEIEVECFYEETFAEAAASTRWYEVEGGTLFYVTQEAESREKLFEASVLANDISVPEFNVGSYEAAVLAQEAIPFIFSPAEGVEMSRGIIPTEISIDMAYFQFTPRDKRMISATGTFDEFVNARKHDGTYLLTVTTTALGWFELLNAFAFEEVAYVVLFHLLGLISVLVVIAFWAVTRVSTTLKHPPRFRFRQYLGLVSAAPSRGIFLGMLPFMTGQFAITFLFQNFTFLTAFPLNIDDLGRDVDENVVAMATAGRMALAFLTLSCYLMAMASHILIPQIPEMSRMREVDDTILMQPESWKRSHYIIANIVCNITNIALMEFSFTDTYGMYFFVVFLLMKVFHLLLEMQTEQFLGEVMLLTPISVGLSLTTGLVTIAADDFTDFTLGYYLDLIIGLIEFVYLDAFIASCANAVPQLKQYISLRLRLRRKSKGGDLRVEADDDINQEDSVVEDLMGFMTSYGCTTAGLYMTPFFIYFYWSFNDYLQLSFLFGFRKKDLLIYLLFALVIIPFQIVMDIFIFNTQELFHGWKVYEYMKYARYRFDNRTARWKGLERSYDESIDYSLRSVDQMCFSSQFYFILAIGGSGSFLFALSMSMMLRARYNMFADILFGVMVALTLGLCVVAKKVFMFLAEAIGLWKISQQRMDENTIREEDVPEFEPVAKGGERTKRGDFTIADLSTEVFRRKFLEHNRLWLMDHISGMLTPRTAKRFRAAGGNMRISGAMSESDSDGGDRDVFVDKARLSDGARRVMLLWRHEALKRMRGGRFSTATGLSDTSDSDAVGAAPRFPPAFLSPEATALLKGWLAASRAVRFARGEENVAELSSTDTDGETAGGARWGTPILSEPTMLLAEEWLRAARVRTRKPPQNALYSDSDASSEDGYPSLVALRSASTGALLTWLGAARARLAEQGSDRALLADSTTSSSGDSSDDWAGGGGRFSQPVVVSEVAQSLVKWWLSNTRRVAEEEGGGGVGAENVDVDFDVESDDDFEDSSEDSFPTSPMTGVNTTPGVNPSVVSRDATLQDTADDSDSDPAAGSSGSSALDSSD